MIEVLIDPMRGYEEIVVPDGLSLKDIHPHIMDGSIWPELERSPGAYVNPAQIVLIRES